MIPAAELAIARHRGSPSDIDLTYGELGAHVMRHDISLDAPLREYYRVGLLDTDIAHEWETEIGWPIFRSDPRSYEPVDTLATVGARQTRPICASSEQSGTPATRVRRACRCSLPAAPTREGDASHLEAEERSDAEDQPKQNRGGLFPSRSA